MKVKYEVEIENCFDCLLAGKDTDAYSLHCKVRPSTFIHQGRLYSLNTNEPVKCPIEVTDEL